MTKPAVDDRLIDVVASDTAETEHDTRLIAKKKTELGSTFYSSLITALVGLSRSEEEAEELWNILLIHKYEMSQKIGRNVGIRVAAMDYFSNITRDLGSVRIIDSQVLLKTAMMAITDELTGLYNHRYFQDRLQQEIDQADETGQSVSLIIFDIDFFKTYNDVNGHVAGDVAIHQVAECCRKTVGEQGITARYGGEEYAVIMPGKNKEEASTLAEEIRKAVEQAVFPNQFILPEGHMTVSLGVAEYPHDGNHRRLLIEYADRCMYHSKRNGKNQVTSYAPNRRRRDRTAKMIPLVITNYECNSLPESFPGNSLNISMGGMLIETSLALPQNTALHIRPLTITSKPNSEIFGVVTRCIRQKEDIWRSGIRFVRLPDEMTEVIDSLINSPGESQ